MINPVYFDIETGPLPLTYLEATMPKFKAPANLKDPVKIAAAIEEKKKEYIEDAALDPLTGQILCIGVLDPLHGFQPLGLADDEAAMLRAFWRIANDALGNFDNLIGFNCNSFDLPFLVKRSWKHGIRPPLILRNGRYWSKDIIDLREVWQMGDKQAHGSLDTVSRFLGQAGKAGEGSQFAELWADNRDVALTYLKTDLLLTQALAERMI